jgi:hypothetical protein
VDHAAFEPWLSKKFRKSGAILNSLGEAPRDCFFEVRKCRGVKQIFRIKQAVSLKRPAERSGKLISVSGTGDRLWGLTRISARGHFSTALSTNPWHLGIGFCSFVQNGIQPAAFRLHLSTPPVGPAVTCLQSTCLFFFG